MRRVLRVSRIVIVVAALLAGYLVGRASVGRASVGCASVGCAEIRQAYYDGVGYGMQLIEQGGK